ncbi:hypothetical protein HPB51_016448 [Rhipicephalus microplus]|uniref:Uncharacterized protein n=1 Tax=Rhipicephalus microplus TaxID=6941 RepID=A0A9J6DW27_RHIMP|nr:hypothetical protein HPB51_016448 [Rhipicephalus microplus]
MNTSTETLMAHLRVRTHGVEIITARMIGTTKSAAITFFGPTLPRTVYYYGGELRCYPFRPTIQVCKVCREKGHRADVCPHPDRPICRLCGLTNPTDGHPCSISCASCGEAHPQEIQLAKKDLSRRSLNSRKYKQATVISFNRALATTHRGPRISAGSPPKRKKTPTSQPMTSTVPGRIHGPRAESRTRIQEERASTDSAEPPPQSSRRGSQRQRRGSRMHPTGIITSGKLGGSRGSQVCMYSPHHTKRTLSSSNR